MTGTVTLSLYISRQFLGWVLTMLAALTGLVSMFDFIELLRRSASRPDATFARVSEIASLRLPYIAMQILPFAVLLGGIIAFWRLTRSSELVVARAAGVSAWQFLAAPVLVATLLGAGATVAITPLSAVLLARAELLDNLYLRTGGGPLDLAGGQLWLRQSDRGLERPGQPAGVSIIHALGVKLHGKDLSATNVSVFRLDAQRSSAVAHRGEPRRSGARATGPCSTTPARDHGPTICPSAIATGSSLPTDLTVSRVQESFASPDTLSLWAVARLHIALLDRGPASHRCATGCISSRCWRCRCSPATMGLVSAGFSMRPTRRGGVARMVGSGVAAGFALFTDLQGRRGVRPVGRVAAVLLAAWAPAAAGLMLAVAHLAAASSRTADDAQPAARRA